jgi:hypothetical protein
MTILSCQMCTRNDIMHEVRTILNQSSLILSSLNTLELCRLYTFLSYNFIDLFDEDLESGEPYLRSAFERHNHPTVEYIALDFIFNQT